MRYKVIPEEHWSGWWEPLYTTVNISPPYYKRSKRFKLHRTVMRLKRRYWSEVYWNAYKRKGRMWRGVLTKRY